MAGSFRILVTFALAVCVIEQAQAMAYIQKALNFDNCGELLHVCMRLMFPLILPHLQVEAIMSFKCSNLMLAPIHLAMGTL